MSCTGVMDGLPNEVIEHIALFLQPKELLALAGTARRYRATCRDSKKVNGQYRVGNGLRHLFFFDVPPFMQALALQQEPQKLFTHQYMPEKYRFLATRRGEVSTRYSEPHITDEVNPLTCCVGDTLYLAPGRGYNLPIIQYKLSKTIASMPLQTVGNFYINSRLQPIFFLPQPSTDIKSAEVVRVPPWVRIDKLKDLWHYYIRKGDCKGLLLVYDSSQFYSCHANICFTSSGVRRVTQLPQSLQREQSREAKRKASALCQAIVKKAKTMAASELVWPVPAIDIMKRLEVAQASLNKALEHLQPTQ